jgi:RNA polymerase sigma-70 factor, ECF subfamily
VVSPNSVTDRVETEPSFAATWPSPEFAAIYNEHSRAIFHLALRFLGDQQQAEDATHDVFVKAFRKLGQFRGRSSLRTWLYRIAINHCRNLVTSWHHRHILTADADSEWLTSGVDTETPLRVLETKELGQRIQRALDALSPDYRLLLLLVADEQLSYEEIAVMTEQTADAVRGKLHRARKMFLNHFQKTA